MLIKEKDSIAPSSPIKTRNNYHCTERANMKLLLRQRRAQRQGVSYPPATLLGSTRPSQSSREMDGAKTTLDLWLNVHSFNEIRTQDDANILYFLVRALNLSNA